MKKRTAKENQSMFRSRGYLVMAVLVCCATVLGGRAVDLQVLNKDFYNDKADSRQVRTVPLAAHRGPILDRNGEPLAVSTPVDSVWARPADVLQEPDYIPALADALEVDAARLTTRLTRNANSQFMWLRRHLSPTQAERVLALKIPGVHADREYRRFYPATEVTGHLLGFTNIDDDGQEGLERSYDHHLQGEPGVKKVLRDGKGRTIDEIELISAPRPGQSLALSLDLRIQYLAYRELKAAILENRAESGSAVVIDIATGEVLAMVNQPAYNPNDGAQRSPALYRNRAITDIIEPGSTLKPFVVAAALESGMYTPDSIIDTNPGRFRVSSKLVVSDKNNNGEMTLESLIQKSSNVAAAKVALALKPEDLWLLLDKVGVGNGTASGFPGESAGLLAPHENWRPVSIATLSYGYGVSMTPLQLAQAYAVLGAGGLHRPVSLVRVSEQPIGRRAMSEATARTVVNMMESVVVEGGTALQAAVDGYRVAGKTGTSHKAIPGGYDKNHYVSVFAGVAPASNPRLAMAVIVDNPRNGQYYGGAVAGPVFASVMAGSLRLLAVAPDDLDSLRTPEDPMFVSTEAP